MDIFQSTEITGDYQFNETESPEDKTSRTKKDDTATPHAEPKIFVVSGVQLVESGQDWLGELIKAFDHLLTKEWESLNVYEPQLGELMLVLSKNVELFPDYKDELEDLFLNFEDYLGTKCPKEADYDFWEVQVKCHGKDPKACLANYEKLFLRTEIDVARYLCSLRTVKKSSFFENWRKKGSIIKRFLSNKNLVYEFGRQGELSIQNVEIFGLVHEVFEHIQQTMDELYYCYYRKSNLKALDFHYLWS